MSSQPRSGPFSGVTSVGAASRDSDVGVDPHEGSLVTDSEKSVVYFDDPSIRTVFLYSSVIYSEVSSVTEDRSRGRPEGDYRTMRLRSNRITSEESSGGGTGAEYYVLGGEHVGVSVARRLQTAGHSVTVVDETYDSDEIQGLRGDPGDVRTLEAAGVSEGSTVVVAAPSDSRNLLTVQLVRTQFDVAEIVVLVNDPDRYDLFTEIDCEPVCATTALCEGIVESLGATGREPNQNA